MAASSRWTAWALTEKKSGSPSYTLQLPSLLSAPVEEGQQVGTLRVRLGEETDLHFIDVELTARDAWTGKLIRDLALPRGMLIAAVHRQGETLVPRGDVILKAGDRLVICAKAHKQDQNISLSEIVLSRDHEWNGSLIRDLDISRQTHIVMVRRRGTMLVPHGSMKLQEGDTVLLYSKERPHDVKF